MTVDDSLRVLTVRSRVARNSPVAIAQVCVEGEIDADNIAVLRAVLLHSIATCPLVHCDLSGVTFLAAAGVNMLAAVARRAAVRGVRVELHGVRGLTRRVLEIAGLERVLLISG
ncbi:STAS domain-containing protein [Actinoplanes utahensis]|uniref:STAS domain-containing protein n=1 Tax=Actinoplanes utahensis TaxID=1869 RepID=A0A0A6UNS1_ACTUT|nr:STAS domain-containing protein [Actinoplanes utahensis]KHD76723.1 hypothetical protein MB27_15675 [Actinoplanes utahensis]GIF33215.1 hypothetical protein Aut01nite_62010 [Actinoplanes utahensis]